MRYSSDPRVKDAQQAENLKVLILRDEMFLTDLARADQHDWQVRLAIRRLKRNIARNCRP